MVFFNKSNSSKDCNNFITGVKFLFYFSAGFQELADKLLTKIFQTPELSLFVHQYQAHSDEFVKNYNQEHENERKVLELDNGSSKKNSRKSILVEKEEPIVDYFMEYMKIFIRKSKVGNSKKVQ
jgi:hypothetical protein